MPETQAVYRSTDPQIAAYVTDCERREREANEALGEFLRGLDTHDPEHPQVRIFTRNWGPTWWLDGVHAKTAPGPLWREADRGLWVPNRRTKAGKELGAQVEAIGFTFRRVPGMPRNLSTPTGLGTNLLIWPTVEALGGCYWCAWKVTGEQVEQSSAFDPALWERAKLSEFYAALEAEGGA